MPPKAEAFSISFGDGGMGGDSKLKPRPRPKKGQSFQFLKRDEGVSALGKVAGLVDANGSGANGKIERPSGGGQKKSAAFRAAIQHMKTKGQQAQADAFSDSMVAVPKAAPPRPAWTVRDGEDPYGQPDQKPSRPPLQEKHSNAPSPAAVTGGRRVTSPDADARKPHRDRDDALRRPSNSASTQSHACPSPSGRRHTRTPSVPGRQVRKPHTASHPQPNKPSLAQRERGFDLSIDTPLTAATSGRKHDADDYPSANPTRRGPTNREHAALRAREEGFVLDLVPSSPVGSSERTHESRHDGRRGSPASDRDDTYRSRNTRQRRGASPHYDAHDDRFDVGSDGSMDCDDRHRRAPARRGRELRTERDGDQSGYQNSHGTSTRTRHMRDRSRDPDGGKRGGYGSFSSRDGMKESMSMSDDIDAYEKAPRGPPSRHDDTGRVQKKGSRSSMSEYSSRTLDGGSPYDDDVPPVDPTVLQHLEEKVAKEKELLRRQERLLEAATEEAEAARRTKATLRAIKADIQQLRMSQSREEEEFEERLGELKKAIERTQSSNLSLEKQIQEEHDTVRMLQDEEELRWAEVEQRERELEEQKYRSMKEKERRGRDRERRRTEAAKRERDAREREEMERLREQHEEQRGIMEEREAASRDGVMREQLEDVRLLRMAEREGREAARGREHERLEREWEAQVAQQEREEEERRREEREAHERRLRERERQRQVEREQEVQRQREREEEERREVERQLQLEREQREREQREREQREREQREREQREREREQREQRERERLQREREAAEVERQRQAELEAETVREAEEREREAREHEARERELVLEREREREAKERPPQHPKSKRERQPAGNGSQKLHFSVYMAEADEQEPLVNIPNDPIIDRRENQDGKVELYYASRKREVTYSNGTRKVVYPTGHIFLEFNNLDVRKTYPSGKVVYYYHQAETTHTTTKSGVQFFEFHSNGQTERHNPDGSKIINFPDGTSKFIRADGVEQSLPSRASLSDDIHKWLNDSVHPQIK